MVLKLHQKDKLYNETRACSCWKVLALYGFAFSVSTDGNLVNRIQVSRLLWKVIMKCAIKDVHIACKVDVVVEAWTNLCWSPIQHKLMCLTVGNETVSLSIDYDAHAFQRQESDQNTNLFHQKSWNDYYHWRNNTCGREGIQLYSRIKRGRISSSPFLHNFTTLALLSRQSRRSKTSPPPVLAQVSENVTQISV